MTSTFYIDERGNGQDGYFQQHNISNLTSSILELRDPSPAIPKILRLVHLLLLSDHINKAHDLICALHKYSELIVPSESYFAPYNSLSLQYFWQTHADLSRPENATLEQRNFPTPESYIAKEQWGKYRDCCRTGWMLEHCNLPAPDNPHIWRETDDPAMLAMCCRLLAKNKNEGEYPSQERIREALEVAKKLYTQPQVYITEWTFDETTEKRMGRHSYLLYRRLAIELAIRMGELETAAEFLSLGLRLDGFNSVDGGQLEDHLFVPGIYDVLPLLAAWGKESNPFFIDHDDAEVMVKEIRETLEIRVREGRQWSLASDKVGWKELLDRLAKGAWKVNRKEYKAMDVTCADDILYSPATEKQIEKAEKKVGKLPEDFKEMIRVANGFMGGWHFLSGGIAGIQGIEIADEDLDNYAADFARKGLKQGGALSGEMIQLQAGSECDSFYHYIIPPVMWKENVLGSEVADGEYQYWHWAPWAATIHAWDSVRDWVASCVEEVEAMAEKGESVEFDGDDFDTEEDEDSKASEDEGEEQEEEELLVGNDGVGSGDRKEKAKQDKDWEKVDISPNEGPMKLVHTRE